MSELNKKFLEELLAIPTAPFREQTVKGYLFKVLTAQKIAHFEDPSGNIVVGVKNQKEYLKLVKQKSKDPVRVFMAHLDHPGFHGTKWASQDVLEATWYGGSPRAFLEGAEVYVSNGHGIEDRGTILSVELNKSQSAIAKLKIKVKGVAKKDTVRAEDLFGAFQFRSHVWKENQIYYTKAADDLVGAFSIVTLAKKMKGKPMIGLLTRAEEVGYIGAIHHFDLGWLKNANRPILCISLETSRTLPGADIGKGAILRIGDRNTTFDAGALKVFWEMAERKFKGKYQRRIMDGGTCEASVSIAHGFPTVGISVPLGNYHNQSLEGGPDSRGKDGPAPEFIHEDDIQGLLNLCEGLMDKSLNWSAPWKNQLKRFAGLKKEYSKLMRPPKRSF